MRLNLKNKEKPHLVLLPQAGMLCLVLLLLFVLMLSVRVSARTIPVPLNAVPFSQNPDPQTSFFTQTRLNSAPYPLIETFDSSAAFSQTSEHVVITDGRVQWDVQGDGPQYVYRQIPAFNGDFRLTVRGQIDGGEYNCGIGAGVGDDPNNGTGVTFQLTGGGCPTYGPVIGAFGAQLNRRYRGCEPEGVFLWVQEGTAYTATLTFTHPEGQLAVDGVGKQSAIPQYEGIIDTLVVGINGYPGMLRCLGSIDTMIVEPLNALIAPTDLTATTPYPTEIDLSWQENAEGESEIRVERWEESVGWQEIASLPANSTSYNDTRVTCDTIYRYRTAAYKDDGSFSGYSPSVEVTTMPCAVDLREDWESGISVLKWKVYGFPHPQLRHGVGVNSSVALDPNGDGNFASGVISKKSFDIASGINAEAWMRSHGPVGQIFSAIEFALSTCQASDRYEECGNYTNVAHVISSAEVGAIIYQVLQRQKFREPFSPLDDTWQRYNIRIRPDGYVEFYRNGELKFIDPEPIDLSAYRALTIDVRGRSINSYNYIDDIKVKTPAKPAWYLHVTDTEGRPVSDAVVYAHGQALGRSNQAGLINSQPLETGTPLVATVEMAERSTARAAHNGWAYRIYLTSLDWEGDTPQPYLVTHDGEQHLILNPNHPLVLFNILVSIEWDATDEYLDQIARAMQAASSYLLDVSDGQMAFGHVAIYENAEHWNDADIQISARNVVRPHAYIGGITATDTSLVIRLGRAWDGRSGAEGPWDASDGYRTIVHEFGHYALGLWDEYYTFVFDDKGQIKDSLPASCTGIGNHNPATTDVNASIMDYQYTTSELSARAVPGLWSPSCEETAQFQMTGQSAWETLISTFGDTQEQPRWQFYTPFQDQKVTAGPHSLPADLPAWPEVEIHATASSASPRQLQVLDPGEQPYPGALVALYKRDGRVFGEGFTNEAGQIVVFGAEEGDTIRASSIDGGLAGRVSIDVPTDPITLTLSSVGSLSGQTVAERPYLQLIAEPSPDSQHVDLLVFLHHFSPWADPVLVLTPPGEETGYAPPLSYSPSTGTYRGQVSTTASKLGMGRVRILGVVQDGIVRQQMTFRLQRASRQERHDIFSDDGNLDLHLMPGSLPGNETYLVVMPPGALPGLVPPGYTVVGNAYSITASGAVVTLEKSALLRLHYNDTVLPPEIDPERLEIRRWDPVTSTWKTISATLDDEQRTLSAAVDVLGTYALMVQTQTQVYLPAIVQ
ncbi:MAG: hypothetical protein GXP38_10095 [Chloroflexi bacterium]|nr:hypothetical protein [Chloroflexota bacterium]